MKYYKKISKQKGSALLLALFVMGAMVIVGLGTASLSINQIKQSREIKKSTIAFYIAESTIEDGLFQIRKNGKTVENLTGYETISFLDEGLDEYAASTITFNDDEEEVFDQLKVGEVVSLDLYNLDDLSSSSVIRSISLEWDGKQSSWLEVSWKSLDNSSYYSELINIQKRYIPYGSGGEKIVDLTAGQLGNYGMHIVQIKALYDEVKNLKIKAYRTTGGGSINQVNIPSRVYISSLGEYPIDVSNQARYNITVSMPEKIPLSPLFDFVIFSEDDLTKTIIEIGSNRPRLIYGECGPYVEYPLCKWTFDDPSSKSFFVQNIGIQTAIITQTSIIITNGNFTIDTGASDCDPDPDPVELEYMDGCLLVVQPTPNSLADLEIEFNSTEYSPLKMLLKARNYLP